MDLESVRQLITEKHYESINKLEEVYLEYITNVLKQKAWIHRRLQHEYQQKLSNLQSLCCQMSVSSIPPTCNSINSMTMNRTTPPSPIPPNIQPIIPAPPLSSLASIPSIPPNNINPMPASPSPNISITNTQLSQGSGSISGSGSKQELALLKALLKMNNQQQQPPLERPTPPANAVDVDVDDIDFSIIDDLFDGLEGRQVEVEPMTGTERDANACKSLGDKHMESGNYYGAVQHYKRAITLQPFNASLYMLRAAAYAKMNKLDCVIKDSHTASEIDANCLKSYCYEGLAQSKRSNFKRAHAAYSKLWNKLKSKTGPEWTQCIQWIHHQMEHSERKRNESKSRSRSVKREPLRIDDRDERPSKRRKKEHHPSLGSRSGSGSVHSSQSYDRDQYKIQCQYCPYKAIGRDVIKNHEAIHEREVPYPYRCRSCSYSSQNKYRLQQHEVLHDINDDDDDGRRSGGDHQLQRRRHRRDQNRNRNHRKSSKSKRRKRPQFALKDSETSPSEEEEDASGSYLSEQETGSGGSERSEYDHMDDLEEEEIDIALGNRQRQSHNNRYIEEQEQEQDEDLSVRYERERIHLQSLNSMNLGLGIGTIGSTMSNGRNRSSPSTISSVVSGLSGSIMSGSGMGSGMGINSYSNPGPHSQSERRKVIECRHCLLQFRSKDLLNEHLKTHATERPLKCPHCDQRFVQKNHLTSHLRVHSPPDDTFMCIACDLRFRNKTQLKRHRRNPDCKGRVEMVETNGVKTKTYSVDEEPAKCPICNKKFQKKKYMVMHMESMHVDPKPFLCTRAGCGQKFRIKEDLDHHLEKQH